MSNSPRTGLAVAGLSLGTALNPLNSSMIAVALVVLREDFGLDVATVTWVITSFYLTSAAGQPLMGRLADRFGPRRLFELGMVLVAVTCALAPFVAELRGALRGPRRHGPGHGGRVPVRRRDGRGPGEAGEREVQPAAGPDPDGQHLRGRRRAGGGRAAGGLRRLAGAVPAERPAGPGRGPPGPAGSPRRTGPGNAARRRNCCGTRTFRASWPSSAPWSW